MAIIRHKQRLVHRQLVQLITDGLTEMGWVEGDIIFDATPATIVDYQPEERGKAIKPNTIAISMGDEREDAPFELGSNLGGLQHVEIPLFVDVYGEAMAISIALASDVKYILKNVTVPLMSWNDTPTGATLEIEEVVGPEIPSDAITQGGENFKRHWRVIKARTFTYFTE